MRLKKNLTADAALVLTTLVWGSTFVVAKDVLDYWPPVAYLTLRFGLAAVSMAVLFGQQIRAADKRAWAAGAALGVLTGGGFALQAIGQVYTTPSKSAFITGLATPLVPFVAFVLLRARPSLENLLGVVLASIGGALIVAPQGDGANFGDVLTLLCTLMFATHITLMSVYAKRMDARQLAALQIIAAALVFGLVWAALRLSAQVFAFDQLPRAVVREASATLVWSGRVVWQEIYLALVATTGTFLAWTWAQGKMSATHAAIIFSLEPVFATLFAVMVRGRSEWLGQRGMLGASLVLAGVLVSEVRLRNRRSSATKSGNDDALLVADDDDETDAASAVGVVNARSDV